MQTNIHGARPQSDQEVDEIMRTNEFSIMRTTSVTFEQETWVRAHFNSEQITQCTLSIKNLPEVRIENGDVTAAIKEVQSIVLRLLTNDHQWPFGHTGIIAWRTRWDHTDRLKGFTGHAWILFSSTELVRRVKATFDRQWIMDWKHQRAPLMVIWEPFHFHGIRGNDDTIIDADGLINGLVWTGSHVWSGFDQSVAHRGHIDFPVKIKARWEQLWYAWVNKMGYVAEAVIGPPQLREY